MRWALRYMVRFSLRCRQATRRTCSHVLLGKVRDYLQSRIPMGFFFCIFINVTAYPPDKDTDINTTMMK